ncbi:Uncharacterized protein TCM_019198 [Theobroma cacao]|uniref:Secreted protein n=1 Tax=Theobroma cacao TaxID=3641 RepID=A0A061EG19_THECC|nr:Uncharacterized protein TCM_019198 [Theobroma cacao]
MALPKRKLLSIFYMLSFVSLGAKRFPNCFLLSSTRTSKAPQSSPITSFKRTRFNPSESVSLAYVEVITSQERSYLTPS